MIVGEIVADKRLELEATRSKISESELREAALKQTPPLDLAPALGGDSISIIAEVKKASPSRGVIRSDFDPVAIATTYAASGASAISVLTETKYFQGSLNHLRDIRNALGDNRPPLLRKDFILEPYQVYESRANGADCLLLIVAILLPDELENLLGLSHQLGMGCLVEVHNQAELKTALNSQARIIGINNRDLATFEVDLTTTERLRPLIPPDTIVVSESGIKDRSDIVKLREWGVDAVLIGESLMVAPDISAKINKLLGVE